MDAKLEKTKDGYIMKMDGAEVEITRELFLEKFLSMEITIKNLQKRMDMLSEKDIDDAIKATDEDKLTVKQKKNWAKLKDTARERVAIKNAKYLETLESIKHWRNENLAMIKEDMPERFTYLEENYDKLYKEMDERFSKKLAAHLIKNDESDPVIQ